MFASTCGGKSEPKLHHYFWIIHNFSGCDGTVSRCRVSVVNSIASFANGFCSWPWGDTGRVERFLQGYWTIFYGRFTVLVLANPRRVSLINFAL